MDFARRQLEKYGWSHGKGLGKHENGISEALKPKLKRSVTGIGHDAAAEFNEHWWSALYDKAAKNVEVEDKNGKTKKIKTVDEEEFKITNNMWRISKKDKKKPTDDEYAEYFVKRATLTNDGTKIENKNDSESEDEGGKKDVFKMTDEELFAACEGRTAHKGARHGLKAVGKLARIAQQEQMLLTQSKYEGYSHAKKTKQQREAVVENTSLDDHEEKPKNKKKNKKKRCNSNGTIDTNIISGQAEIKSPSLDDFQQNLENKTHGDTSEIIKENVGRKSKKLKKSKTQDVDYEIDTDNNKGIKKNKKRLLEKTESKASTLSCNNSETALEFLELPKKKKKKKSKIETE